MLQKLVIIFSTIFLGLPVIGQEKKPVWLIPKELCVMIGEYASSSSVKTIHCVRPGTDISQSHSNWKTTYMCNDEIVRYHGRHIYKQPHFQYKETTRIDDCYKLGDKYSYEYSNMIVPDLGAYNASKTQKTTGIANYNAQSENEFLHNYLQLRCNYKVLRHEKTLCVALAQNQLVALHTLYSEKKINLRTHKLRIFSGALRTRAEQEVGLHPLKLIPISNEDTGFNCEFKKIAWIYGKALCVLNDSGHFYIVSIEHNKQFSFPNFRQKLPFRINTFAVHQPRKNHEIIIADAHDNLYFAALNDRTKENKIKYRKIWNNEEKFKIDQLWFLNDLIYLMNPARECKVIPFGNKNSYTPQQIHQKLMPIYKIASAKKQAVCNQNGFLFDDYEPLNF